MQPFPNFHDGRLTGIHLRTGEAILSLLRLNGEIWEIVVKGLEALRMDEFRDGNIIYGLEVFQGSPPPREALERLYPPPHASAAKTYHDEYARLLEAKTRAVESGDVALVVVTPSYGAEVFALGNSVEGERSASHENAAS